MSAAGQSSSIPPSAAGGPAANIVARRARWVALALVLGGVANNLHSLTWGFCYDDYVHQAVLRRLVSAEYLRPWNLYDFGPRPSPDAPLAKSGFFPWWTSEDFQVRFLRPVTSVSIWADYAVFGDWAPGYHATSLLLFAVFLALSFRLYLAVGAPARAALWGLAFLALEDGVGLPVGWIANRNALLAALFIVATVLCVQEYCASRSRRYGAAAVICLALACGSKESGVVALPISALSAWLFLPAAAGRSLRERCGALLRSPVLWAMTGVTIAFVGCFVLAGYGTRAEIYATPWVEPLGYLRRLAIAMPLGLANLLFGLSTDVLFLYPHLLWPTLVAAIVLLAIAAGIILRTVKPGPTTVFAIGWALLALPPEAGADLLDRLFMNASVGTALLLGLFLDRVLPVRTSLAERRYARVTLAAILVLLGVVLSVPGSLYRAAEWKNLSGTDRRTALSADLGEPGESRSAFLLQSPSSMLAWSLLPTWVVERNDPAVRVFPLQFGRRAVALTREDDRTATLTSRESPFLSEHFEGLFLSRPYAAEPGAVYRAPEFTATAVEVEPGGIRTVRLVFHRSLDDPAYRFLAWQDGRLGRLTPPRIGETIEVPSAPRLMPLMP